VPRPDDPLPPPLSPPPVIDGRSWSCIDFISDLHLCRQDAATFGVFSRYLEATPADALFILGDLFEVWVGDDVLDDPASTFERACVERLRSISARLPVYFGCGNRDFLVGPALLSQAGMQGLTEPALLQTAGPRVLLSHGDAWCLQDHDYLRFRAEVRSAAWQQAFLSQPLPQRLAMARGMREASESRKREHTTYADVDESLATQWLNACQADVLVHGHTHRPATHTLPQNRQRWVLSDWDATAQPARAEALRWQAGGWSRVPLTLGSL
jgi:UDP-2,3-diacylglucosamine hydrolase